MRQHRDRSFKTRYAVLGDGQTEQYYLTHLKTLKGYKYAVYPAFFDDISIEKVDGKIDDLINGGCDLVVYFTDYDTIVNQGKSERFERLKKKYADIPEVMICETMPSIEFWFLLHFVKTTREFRNADEVVSELKRYLPAYSKKKSYMMNFKWVQELCTNGNMEQALSRAETILCQYTNSEVGSHYPFTKVHLGIEKFDKHCINTTCE